jgi:hypothetical protein
MDDICDFSSPLRPDSQEGQSRDSATRENKTPTNAVDINQPLEGKTLVTLPTWQPSRQELICTINSDYYESSFYENGCVLVIGPLIRRPENGKYPRPDRHLEALLPYKHLLARDLEAIYFSRTSHERPIEKWNVFLARRTARPAGRSAMVWLLREGDAETVDGR